MTDDSKPMTDARLTFIKGGLMNPSCKTLAKDAAQELVDEVDRLRADNVILRGDLIKSQGKIKQLVEKFGDLEAP